MFRCSARSIGHPECDHVSQAYSYRELLMIPPIPIPPISQNERMSEPLHPSTILQTSRHDRHDRQADSRQRSMSLGAHRCCHAVMLSVMLSVMLCIDWPRPSWLLASQLLSISTNHLSSFRSCTAAASHPAQSAVQRCSQQQAHGRQPAAGARARCSRCCQHRLTCHHTDPHTRAAATREAENSSQRSGHGLLDGAPRSAVGALPPPGF
jgi:hypothetical protein